MTGQVPSNGSHVTWRELDLALAPIVKGVEEMDKKVDLLIARQAGEDAVLVYKNLAERRKRWLVGTAIALAAVTVAAASALLTIFLGG